MENVAVVGLGYVGLPVLIAIAESGKYKAIGYDVNSNHVNRLLNNQCSFEPELNSKIEHAEIYFTNQPDDLSDVSKYLICVPTPVKNKYEPDLSPLCSALELVGEYLKSGDTVIIESTVNPGVSEEVAIPLLENKTGLKAGVDFDVAHCPERINPGDSKWTVYNIPRNVGATSEQAATKVADFYRSFLQADVKEVSSLKIAEATKILENTFRDINIAYVNELSKSFDLLGIDIVETIQAASSKPFAFLAHYPGCGVGGHCIPVDPYYLISKAQSVGFEHKFLKMAREVNHSMPKYTIKKTIRALNELGMPVKGTKVLLYGLSYKANVGDLRESPALVLKQELESWGAGLLVYDPYIPQASTISNLQESFNDVEVLVIATEHSEIKAVDFNAFKNLKLIIDGRNCLNLQSIPKGIAYHGIGRRDHSLSDSVTIHQEQYEEKTAAVV